MAKQTINIGTSANDHTGTSLRAGGDMINDNFTEIYSLDGGNIKTKTVTGTYANLQVLAADITAAVGLTPVQAGAGYICFGTFTKQFDTTIYLLIVSNGANWFTTVINLL